MKRYEVYGEDIETKAFSTYQAALNYLTKQREFQEDSNGRVDIEMYDNQTSEYLVIENYSKRPVECLL